MNDIEVREVASYLEKMGYREPARTLKTHYADGNLVSRILLEAYVDSGDDAFFAYFYHFSRRKLMSYARRIAASGKLSVEPEDLISETYEIVIDKYSRATSVSEEEPLSYCFGIIRNLVRKNHVKNKGAFKPFSLIEDPGDGGAAPPVEILIAGEERRRAELLKGKIREIVRSSLSYLREREKRILEAYYFSGRKIPEIAGEFGLTVSNVSMLLYRTRKKVTTLLMEYIRYMDEGRDGEKGIRKERLKRGLFELGRYVLFRQKRAVEWIHPGGVLVPLETSLREIETSCRFLLTEKFVEDVGLSTDFLRDCYDFAGVMRRFRKNVYVVENAREAFERALVVDGKYFPARKFMGNYFFFEKDFNSAFCEFRNALGAAGGLREKRICYLCLGLASDWIGNHGEALRYVDLASKIEDDYLNAFQRFVTYLMMGKIRISGKYLTALDGKMKEAGPEGVDAFSHMLHARWFLRNEAVLRKRFGKDPEALGIIKKMQSFDA